MRNRRLIVLAALALAAAGCGPNLVGAGKADRLNQDYELCTWDDRPWYGWIPDPVGALGHIALNQCMRARGWERDHSQLMGWRWVGVAGN